MEPVPLPRVANPDSEANTDGARMDAATQGTAGAVATANVLPVGNQVPNAPAPGSHSTAESWPGITMTLRGVGKTTGH